MVNSFWNRKFISMLGNLSKIVIFVDPYPMPPIDSDWLWGPILGTWIRQKHTSKWFPKT